jgi:hypothetical protein
VGTFGPRCLRPEPYHRDGRVAARRTSELTRQADRPALFLDDRDRAARQAGDEGDRCGAGTHRTLVKNVN